MGRRTELPEARDRAHKYAARLSQLDQARFYLMMIERSSGGSDLACGGVNIKMGRAAGFAEIKGCLP
jgi:hypothetical protein